MPDLLNVEEFTHDDEPGFKVVYEYGGISGRAVKGRVIGRLASKYPLKANKMEVINLESIDKDGVTTTFIVEVFIPIDGIEENKGVRALRNLWQEL